MGQEPLDITHAVFQAAINSDKLSSYERRRRRAQARSSWRWPGIISPRWVTVEPFRYAVGHPSSKEIIVVDADYEFDGASVPWPLTLITPKTHSLYLAAAALHDWLYQKRFEDVDREKADAIFREAMIVLGTSWIWAGLMWRTVRAAGWIVWYKRKDGFLGELARAPWVIKLLPFAIGTLVRFTSGVVFHDLWRWPRLRAEAMEIAEYDAPLQSHPRTSPDA